MQDKLLYPCTSNIWYPGITSHFPIFTGKVPKRRKIVLKIVWKKAKSCGNFKGCLLFPGISLTVY